MVVGVGRGRGVWLQRGRVLRPQVFLVANRTQDNVLTLQLRSVMATTLRTDVSPEVTLTENICHTFTLGPTQQRAHATNPTSHLKETERLTPQHTGDRNANPSCVFSYRSMTGSQGAGKEGPAPQA